MDQEYPHYLKPLPWVFGYGAAAQFVLFGVIDRQFSASPLTALRPISPELRTLHELSGLALRAPVVIRSDVTF